MLDVKGKYVCYYHEKCWWGDNSYDYHQWFDRFGVGNNFTLGLTQMEIQTIVAPLIATDCNNDRVSEN